MTRQELLELLQKDIALETLYKDYRLLLKQNVSTELSKIRRYRLTDRAKAWGYTSISNAMAMRSRLRSRLDNIAEKADKII